MIESFEKQIAKKSDSELTDIFIEESKYQRNFVDLVKLELIKRNLPIDTIIELRDRNNRVIDETLSIGDKGNPVLIALGLFSSLFGGIFAVFIGYNFAYSKRKNSIGKEFFVYDESTRKSGRIMFFLGLTIFTITLITVL